MDNTFWVVTNKETGLYFRKYKWVGWNRSKPKDLWTDRLGRARIFESEAIARNSVPDEFIKADILKFINMLGVPANESN